MPFGLVRFFDVQIKVEATAIFGLLDAVAIVFFSHPSKKGEQIGNIYIFTSYFKIVFIRKKRTKNYGNSIVFVTDQVETHAKIFYDRTYGFY